MPYTCPNCKSTNCDKHSLYKTIFCFNCGFNGWQEALIKAERYLIANNIPMSKSRLACIDRNYQEKLEKIIIPKRDSSREIQTFFTNKNRRR